jgi:hypothetical protein
MPGQRPWSFGGTDEWLVGLSPHRSWWDRFLNTSGDCMEVWCVSSATQVPCMYQSQNKVLGIRLLLPYSWSSCLLSLCVFGKTWIFWKTVWSKKYLCNDAVTASETIVYSDTVVSEWQVAKNREGRKEVGDYFNHLAQEDVCSHNTVGCWGSRMTTVVVGYLHTK